MRAEPALAAASARLAAVPRAPPGTVHDAGARPGGRPPDRPPGAGPGRPGGGPEPPGGSRHLAPPRLGPDPGGLRRGPRGRAGDPGRARAPRGPRGARPRTSAWSCRSRAWSPRTSSGTTSPRCGAAPTGIRASPRRGRSAWASARTTRSSTWRRSSRSPEGPSPAGRARDGHPAERRAQAAPADALRPGRLRHAAGRDARASTRWRAAAGPTARSPPAAGRSALGQTGLALLPFLADGESSRTGDRPERRRRPRHRVAARPALRGGRRPRRTPALRSPSWGWRSAPSPRTTC